MTTSVIWRHPQEKMAKQQFYLNHHPHAVRLREMFPLFKMKAAEDDGRALNTGRLHF